MSVTDLFAGSRQVAQQLQDPTVKTIADSIKRRFVEIRKQKIGERLFELRGFTFEDFYLKGAIVSLPAELSMMLDSQVQQMTLGVEVLVAGVDGTGGHIFSIEDPGVSTCFDRLGYHAIGSGERHALLSLVTLQHHWSKGINEVVHLVYEAKRQAELAQGVGQETDMQIISRGGSCTVSPDVMEALEAIHKARVNPELQRVQQMVNDLPFEKPREQQGNGDA